MPDLERKVAQLDSDVHAIYGILRNIEDVQREQGSRLDGIDGRLDRMDGRFDRMDGRLGQVDDKLDRVLHILEKANLSA